MIPAQDYDFLLEAGVGRHLRPRHARFPRARSDVLEQIRQVRLAPPDPRDDGAQRPRGHSPRRSWVRTRSARAARWPRRSRWSSPRAATTARRPTRCWTRCCPHRARRSAWASAGVPGSGKTTFIEALGLHLVGAGPPRRGAGGGPVVSVVGRLDPRRQDAHGALSVARPGLHPAVARRRLARRRGREDARGDARCARRPATTS